MIVQQGFDWMLGFMYMGGGAPVTYLALGDNGTVATLNDAQLYNELVRKEIGNLYIDSGVLVGETFFDRNEANFHWREAALFAGGSMTPNSGVMIARAVIDESKDDKRTATVVWELFPTNR